MKTSQSTLLLEQFVDAPVAQVSLSWDVPLLVSQRNDFYSTQRKHHLQHVVYDKNISKYDENSIEFLFFSSFSLLHRFLHLAIRLLVIEPPKDPNSFHCLEVTAVAEFAFEREELHEMILTKTTPSSSYLWISMEIKDT